MGCFLGCFGFSSKRKRRKPATKIQPGDHQKLGSYEPLDSAAAKLDIKEQQTNSDLEQRSEESKKTLKQIIRKKVSFNLNVQTYEPIPKAEESAGYSWESEEDKKEESGKETANDGQSYPPGYRYGNYIDSLDEEDELAYEESDLDEDDFDDDYDNEEDVDGIDELRTSQGSMEQFTSLSVKMEDSSTQLGEEKDKNLKPPGDSKAQENSQQVHSVLSPVENLAQWRAIKARGMPSSKHQRKENVASEHKLQKPFNSLGSYGHSTPPMQEVAVNASLSNWLISSDPGLFKTASIPKSSNSDFERTCLGQDREDMPMLDITNF
ncbi:hypothetical protein Tsubulata_009512 [Turnera subulata]|uniref:Uncharacterized protein n=1 Tax=Turnera subulata TaxID=218843 RepID=A0A9Q0FC24_9ROSI|nr:hypothetical protein Tsubulata_009512 [Turnera subulata]